MTVQLDVLELRSAANAGIINIQLKMVPIWRIRPVSRSLAFGDSITCRINPVQATFRLEV